jgi:hypothetical protein
MVANAAGRWVTVMPAHPRLVACTSKGVDGTCLRAFKISMTIPRAVAITVRLAAIPAFSSVPDGTTACA